MSKPSMSKPRTKPMKLRATPAPSATVAPPSNRDLKAALSAKSGIKRRREPEAPAAAMLLPRKGRQDLKGVVIYLNDAAKSQLLRLSIDQDRAIQDLGVEAVNMLFRRYREKPIA